MVSFPDYICKQNHKNNAPLWQVLSMPISPYHKIVKKITKWLPVTPEKKLLDQSNCWEIGACHTW